MGGIGRFLQWPPSSFERPKLYCPRIVGSVVERLSAPNLPASPKADQVYTAVFLFKGSTPFAAALRYQSRHCCHVSLGVKPRHVTEAPKVRQVIERNLTSALRSFEVRGHAKPRARSCLKRVGCSRGVELAVEPAESENTLLPSFSPSTEPNPSRRNRTPLSVRFHSCARHIRQNSP